MEHALTIAGLFLELVGVAAIWQFGWPQPQLQGGTSLSNEDATPPDAGTTEADPRARVADPRRAYRRYSAWGFGSLVFGLLLQGIAQIVDMLPSPS